MNDKKLRVLMLGTNSVYKKAVGPGMGTFATELTRQLEKYVDIKYFTYSNPLSALPKSLLLNRQIAASEANIVHDMTGIAPLIISPSKPYVITIHELAADWISYPKNMVNIKTKLWLAITRKAIKKNLDRADAIIAVSTSIRQFLLDFYDIPKSKIYVINHGVGNEFKIRSNNKNRVFKIGTLSNLIHKKNPHLIISAFKLLSENVGKDKVELDFYGQVSDSILTDLKQRSKGYNVKFKGIVSNDEKPKMFNSLDIFVFPSIVEGFGMPILEAQASGLPVIISDNGIIPNEVKKYCISEQSEESMADRFLDIYKNGYDINLARRAFDYAHSFTWKKSAEMTLKVYENITNE